MRRVELLAPVAYGLVKLIAYSAWCGLGARLHGHTGPIVLKALLFGLLRLAMGVVLGLGLILWGVNMLAQATHDQFLLYLAVYVPTRWVEWSLMVVVMHGGHRSFKNFLVGETSSSRLWRLGGIVVSCLADIPMMLTIGGLPIGRFMC
jgi:hypothetical protein